MVVFVELYTKLKIYMIDVLLNLYLYQEKKIDLLFRDLRY